MIDNGFIAGCDAVCADELLEKEHRTVTDVRQLLEIYIRFSSETGIENAPPDLIDWVARGLRIFLETGTHPFPATVRTGFDWAEVFYFIDHFREFEQIEDRNLESAIEDVLHNFLHLSQDEWDLVSGQISNQIRRYRRGDYTQDAMYLSQRYGVVSFCKIGGRFIPWGPWAR